MTKKWADMIARESADFKSRRGNVATLASRIQYSTTDKAHAKYHPRHRHLMGAGDELEWCNSWPMLGARTPNIISVIRQVSNHSPSCYGSFDPDSRSGTNHWRVMKDPYSISILDNGKKSSGLICERIAPPDDPVMACQADTAAR